MNPDGVRTGTGNTSPVLTSLSAQHAVKASQFIALSDRRVKTNIIDADPDDLVRSIHNLRVKTWSYKDGFHHGTRTRLGFIAQDVPSALSKFAITTHADFVPDIFKHATLTRGKCTYFLRDHGLVKGDIIRFCTDSSSEKATVLDVIDPDTFTLDTESTDSIFVYGKFVTDVMSIDYDSIVAALVTSHQELEKRIAVLETK
jgi:hypothetical protein